MTYLHDKFYADMVALTYHAIYSGF